jgi:hypothetical protein
MASIAELKSPNRFSFMTYSRGVWFLLTDGVTITPDLTNSDFQRVTLGGNRTMQAPLNSPFTGHAARIVFRIRQDATGNRTLSWDSIYRFSGGLAPILSTSANKNDYFHFMYNDTDGKWDLIGDRYNL